MTAPSPPANVGAPPGRSNRRLKALLALNALGFVLYGFIQLDRTTVSGMGLWAENVYDAFHGRDPSAPSAAGKRFKDDVKTLGGSPAVHVVKPGFLGFFGRVEIYNARFDSPEFDDAALARFVDSYGARISNLHLTNTSVTDDGLRRLEGMTNLVHLGIGYRNPGRGRTGPRTKITDAGLAHLAKLPQLQSLNLTDAAITDAGLAAVENLPNLSSLALSRTDVRGPGLAHLQSRPALTYLYISGDTLTDEGLTALAGVTSLQHLELVGIGLNPEQLPLLLRLPRLIGLGLHGCGLLDEEVDALRKARPTLKIQD